MFVSVAPAQHPVGYFAAGCPKRLGSGDLVPLCDFFFHSKFFNIEAKTRCGKFPS
jgi:hypothetical protein